MGGKTATSTQQVQIPPSVLAQYQAVNARATDTAATPFQTYGGQFVAPVNQEQSTGIANTNVGATEAQPYFAGANGTLNSAFGATQPTNAAATGLAAASAGQVNPSDLDAASINKYLSPYLGTVLGSESALLNQNNQQQQSGQLGTAIQSGAFGGDRTGIAAANLEQQQNLANANIYSNILNQGYGQALSTAQQQQGVGLAAGQANRAALANAGQELSGIGATTYGEGANTATTMAGLGAGAQTAALQGAQAQIGAGTVQQQTQQAQDQALYNQFLQQQSYPFQVDQFLANIAEGTGALSGSTTTTQQPGGFFSDRRLKYNIKKIGKTYDGQAIYSYKMHGDPRTHVGLIAQNVEKKHPEAVGLASGYKIVDYGKATEEAANRGHFHAGGGVSDGGRVWRPAAYATGGSPSIVDAGDMQAILAAQQGMYAPMSGGAGVYGEPGGSVPRGGSSRVPPPNGATPHLVTASGTPAPPPSGASNVQTSIGLGKDAYGAYKHFNPTPTTTAPSGGGVAPTPSMPPAADPNYFTPEAASSAGTAGAADTGAASGAASGVTAGTAADAAGSAAAGAAGAGAVDAGATEAAAALAAEYAAADAAVALAAAKRGGRIKYDVGGGTPYEDGTQLDIPNYQPDAHVQTAGPLKKQPTGLQTAMTMGNPNDVGGIIGGMFSNEALARGGVAAGRPGFADGGSPDDVDPTADPDMVGPPAPSGVAAPPEQSAPSGVAAPPAKAEDQSWWNKIKNSSLAKPENLVPLLSAIGAMGTAPTRSWGTALAAGLGAGAQSYVPTQEGLARAGETKAVTTGVNLENQLKQLKVKAAGDWLNAPADSPVTKSTDSATQAAQSVDQKFRSQYFVPPWLPSEQAAMKRGQALKFATGSDAGVQQAQQVRDQRIQNDTAKNQNDARGKADDLYAIATQDPDPAKRQAALVQYNALHQWTGDKYEDLAGSVRNSRTGQPPIGVARQQLTPVQAYNFWHELASPTNVGAKAPLPFKAWAKENGIAIPDDFVPPGTTTAATPAPTPTPAPAPNRTAATAPPAAAPARPAAQTQLINDLKNPATANEFGSPTGAPKTAPPSTPAPAAAATPLDYKDVPPKPFWAENTHYVVPEGQQKEVDDYSAKKAALLDESNGTRELQQQKVSTQRMLNLLPSAKMGPGSATLASVQTMLGNLTGSQFTDWVDSNPAAYQILVKQMGQGALDDTLTKLRAEGAQVRLGQAESNLIINRLSASPEMAKAAAKSLLGWRMQQLNYEEDRLNAIPDYVRNNGDARLFNNWYSKKRPLQGSVSTGAPEGTTIGSAKPMPTGPKLQKYAETHFGGDTGKATQYLKSQGFGR